MTHLEKSWITIGTNHDKELQQEFDSIIINSITWNIKKYVSNIQPNCELTSKKNAELYDSIYNEFDKISINTEFDVPQFKKNYTLIETSNYFTKSQNWIGHVTEINEKSFKAILTDLTNPGTNETIEFDISEISDDDIPLLEVGAAFYWSIGTAYANGQRKKESLVRFQRFSPWTSDDYDNAADRATNLSNSTIWG